MSLEDGDIVGMLVDAGEVHCRHDGGRWGGGAVGVVDILSNWTGKLCRTMVGDRGLSPFVAGDPVVASRFRASGTEPFKQGNVRSLYSCGLVIM